MYICTYIHTLYMYHSQSKHIALPLFTQVLTDNDAERIRSGQCLQSDQINLAVHLIRQQHPQQQGLLCTLLLQSPDKLPKLPPDSIQIHHVAGNHWVCSKNCGTHIKLFDSLYNGWLATDLNTQLQALYLTNEGSLEVRVQRVQQQQGGTDCGLFAIVYAFSLASGEDPTRIKFKQDNMRQHLIDCLQAGTMLPFPVERTITRAARADIVMIN